MTLRKIGSLLLGALLVVGLSSAVSAQTILEDGDGVRIRVTNQNSGEFVGIGDSIVVEVQYLTTIAPTDIRVAIVTDTIDVVASDFMELNHQLSSMTKIKGSLVAMPVNSLSVRPPRGDGEDLRLDTTSAEGHHVESVDGAASFSKVVFTFHVIASSTASINKATLAIMVVVRNDDTDGWYRLAFQQPQSRCADDCVRSQWYELRFRGRRRSFRYRFESSDGSDLQRLYRCQ